MKNPKQKLKNILLLVTVFFAISCSKDAYEEPSYEASKKYKVKSLQRSEIKNLEKKLKNFKAFTKFQYENNRTEISSIYDFSIETNDVKFIEAGNIKSYTFKVNRTVDNGLFENLQIIKKADGNYVAKLLQYNLTNEEQVLFLSGGYLDVNGKLTTINIDDPSFINNINAKLRGDCYDMIITSQENPCASGEHSYGQIGCILPPSLQAKPDSNVYTIVSVNCDTGSGGDLENGVTTTPVSGGGGGSLWNQDSFYSNITLEQQTWLDNQTSTVNESILNYLITNNFNTASKNKIYQLIDYFIQNPSINSEEFENWFLGIVEGKDAFYNDSFWQNTNLNFPQQQLPTWNNFNNSFPRNSDGTFMTGPNNVFGFVGGSVLQARIDNPDTTNNTCALKVSIALNGAGVVIPNIPGQTLQGGGAFAGKYFFLNTKALNNWMKLTFGTNPNNPNHHQFTQSQGGPNGTGFASALNNLSPNHGIFTMLPISAIEFGASGHCDIFDGTNCASHCYFDSASEINIWILP